MGDPFANFLLGGVGYAITISAVAAIGGFLFGFDSGVINGTVDALSQTFDTQSAVTGFAVASVLLGCAVGAFIAMPPPFRYFDKGNMAVVGKGFAVLQSGKFQLSGFVAWLAWAFIHLLFLAQPSLRVSVFVHWVWTYLTGTRRSRLILSPGNPAPANGARSGQKQT